MSEKRQELLKISEQIGRCPSAHRTMPVRAPADILWVELPQMTSDVYLQKYEYILYLHRYFTSEDQIHIKIQQLYISLEQLRMNNVQEKIS